MATVQLMAASGLPCFGRGKPVDNLRTRFRLDLTDAQVRTSLVVYKSFSASPQTTIHIQTYSQAHCAAFIWPFAMVPNSCHPQLFHLHAPAADQCWQQDGLCAHVSLTRAAASAARFVLWVRVRRGPYSDNTLQAADFMRKQVQHAYNKWTTGFYDYVQYVQNRIPK